MNSLKCQPDYQNIITFYNNGKVLYMFTAKKEQFTKDTVRRKYLQIKSLAIPLLSILCLITSKTYHFQHIISIIESFEEQKQLHCYYLSIFSHNGFAKIMLQQYKNILLKIVSLWSCFFSSTSFLGVKIPIVRVLIGIQNGIYRFHLKNT